MDDANPTAVGAPYPAVCQQPVAAASLDTALQRVIATQQIVDVVNLLATSADAGNWAALRSCLADRVVVDYTSLNGGEPVEMAADALVEQWQFLDGFHATQHVIANHQVAWSVDTATCDAYVVAHHYLPNDAGGAFWRLGGRYHDELVKSPDGWKIRRITLSVLWTEGNADLLALAGERHREREALAAPPSPPASEHG